MNVMKIQIGGDYLISNYQSVELINDLGLNYIQGNIIKLITHYCQDRKNVYLEKIIHYCELGKILRFKSTAKWNADKVNRYILENKITNIHLYTFSALCRGHYDVVKNEFCEILNKRAESNDNTR